MSERSAVAWPMPTGEPRCPSCGARLPLGAATQPWCGLCLAPLGPVPAAAPVAPPPTASPSLPPPSTPPLAGPAGVDAREVERMLVELKASAPDPWAAPSQRFGSKPRRVALAVGIALCLTAALLAAAAIAGALLP